MFTMTHCLSPRFLVYISSIISSVKLFTYVAETLYFVGAKILIYWLVIDPTCHATARPVFFSVCTCTWPALLTGAAKIKNVLEPDCLTGAGPRPLEILGTLVVNQQSETTSKKKSNPSQQFCFRKIQGSAVTSG